MASGNIVGDCRSAAKGLADTHTFETGQSILLEAAREIELLREAVFRYGDRARMSRAPEHLQYPIDVAMQMCALKQEGEG